MADCRILQRNASEAALLSPETQSTSLRRGYNRGYPHHQKTPQPTTGFPEIRTDTVTVQQGLDSPGQFIDARTRLLMESRFKHDFSPVRVHTNPQAAASAQVMNARAYTIGNNIIFANGQYAPSTVPGQRLLAHELTHVIQQHSSNNLEAQNDLEISHPRDAAEQEASAIASKVADGKSVQVKQRNGLAVHRDVWDWLGPTLGVVGGLAVAGAIGYGIYALVRNRNSGSQGNTALSDMTAWELAQVSPDRVTSSATTAATSTDPRIEDYARASRFIRSLFAS